MKPALRRAYAAEMAAAARRFERGQLDLAMRHLELAHVLGQRHVLPHVITHWWMLRIGLRRRVLGEVTGQGLRIVLGALGSAAGIVPTGNTGGTDVGMFRRMPVDAEIRRLIDS
ncbi:MAG TPA: DUF3703 domain-containing protein [Noviherbaspirillum sp.]|jgi:hypothetical protein|uniref:DUF3703 domain-containing protein n=1 Tax=Noviherbaspirillum sp. TaxID=1926288 RepID=UPI002F95682E